MAKFGKKYRNVEEMTKALSNDDAFADEVAQMLRGQAVVRELFALRNKAGLTQTELAEKIGWSQSQVSRLEHDEDRNVTLGELQAYLGGLGLSPALQLDSTADKRAAAAKLPAKPDGRKHVEIQLVAGPSAANMQPAARSRGERPKAVPPHPKTSAKGRRKSASAR